MGFSFIHTADIHLGRPFSDITVSGEKFDICASACKNTLNKLADIAITKKVDFVLFGGDNFDSEEHDLGTKLLFINTLKRLADNGIKSYIICGNHDPIELYKKYESYFKFEDKYQDLINITGITTKASSETFSPLNGVKIHTVSFETEEGDSPLNHLEKVSDSDFHIGLIHCDLDKTDSKYAPCSREDLRKLGYDYYALGHIHIPSDNEDNLIYAGSPQSRTRKETGEHGCYYICVNDKKITKDFIPIDCVRFNEIEIDCSDFNNKAEIFEKIIETANNSAQNIELNLFEINLIGVTKSYEELNNTQSIFEDYTENYGKDEKKNVSVYKINNMTKPDVEEDLILSNTGVIGLIANSFSDKSEINVDEIYDNISEIHETIYQKLKLDEYSQTVLSEALRSDKEEIMESVKNEIKSLCKEIYNME